jgi:hypothetical protein
VQEIFAVQSVQGVLFPEIVHEGELLGSSYALPDKALKEVGFSPPPEPKPETPASGYVAPDGTAAPAAETSTTQ